MSASNPELLRSLGKLARGLSALFWGLPAALLICVETARADWLKPLAFFPALAVNALILFGLWQMGEFQKQERPWRHALDRAKLLAVVDLGLCPFLFWFAEMPQQIFFRDAAFIFALSTLIFLFNLNAVLKQLGAMLPDETLRQETRQFTAFNRWLLVIWLVIVVLSIALPQFLNFTRYFSTKFLAEFLRMEIALLLLLGLMPIAITMALVWKAKEVILDSVFGARN